LGTRINVLFDHNLTDFGDRESVLARLSASLPAALAVEEYWQLADPKTSKSGKLNLWRADPVSPIESNLNRYTGPGSLFLTITPKAAGVHTGGRWRGFLEIEPLRRVHLKAFRGIGTALGATCFALYADSGEVDDLFWGGRTQWECILLMEQIWGPPQESIEEIDERSISAVERKMGFPFVWFLENSSVG
jgi:hypothetical protein